MSSTEAKPEASKTILEEIGKLKAALVDRLPGYKIEWISTGIYTSGFGTVEESCIRFKCVIQDKSGLTEEQIKILEDNGKRSE